MAGEEIYKDCQEIGGESEVNRIPTLPYSGSEALSPDSGAFVFQIAPFAALLGGWIAFRPILRYSMSSLLRSQ